MVLLQTCIVGLLLVLEAPSSAVAVNLTSNPAENVFCNGSDVIFTCVTRGSDTLEWRGDIHYVGDRIGFAAELQTINTTKNSSSSADTVATLTQNSLDDDVRVLVSTLRITALSNVPSGTVTCVNANDSRGQIGFQVLSPPMIPQVVVTFQLEHVKNMCAIASVLQSPTNPAQADATTYTVSVDGSSVPYRNASFISADGIRHSTLVYEVICGAHNISISAINICGQSPGAYEITLDPGQRFMLNVTSFGSASNVEGSVVAVIVGVVLVAVKDLLDQWW